MFNTHTGFSQQFVYVSFGLLRFCASHTGCNSFDHKEFKPENEILKARQIGAQASCLRATGFTYQVIGSTLRVHCIWGSLLSVCMLGDVKTEKEKLCHV